eukprot:gene10041-biopygen12342
MESGACPVSDLRRGDPRGRRRPVGEEEGEAPGRLEALESCAHDGHAVPAWGVRCPHGARSARMGHAVPAWGMRCPHGACGARMGHAVPAWGTGSGATAAPKSVRGGDDGEQPKRRRGTASYWYCPPPLPTSTFLCVGGKCRASCASTAIIVKPSIWMFHSPSFFTVITDMKHGNLQLGTPARDGKA